MRIAHLTPAFFSPDSYIGGGERYVDYIVQALRSVEGIQQCVFSLGAEDRIFERNGIVVRILRNESAMPGQVNGFSAALWQELPGFDLVHLHQSLTVFGAYSVAIVRSLGIPIVGTDLGGGEHPLMLRGRGLELLDGNISISRYAFNLLEKFYSGPHEILIGPVDTDHFSPDEKGVRNRHRILCVSRIMPHKGIDRVVAALPDNLSLTVVGKVYHDEYYDLLRRMAKNKDVNFINDADDDTLLRLYRNSGLFVQASTARDIYGNTVAKSELMGLTTLEAMACGLPVVVSDTGSLPELVPDPRFGRVFHEEKELSDILVNFSACAWPDADAGTLARTHVVETHGMRPIAHRLVSFYSAVLADHKKRIL